MPILRTSGFAKRAANPMSAGLDFRVRLAAVCPTDQGFVFVIAVDARGDVDALRLLRRMIVCENRLAEWQPALQPDPVEYLGERDIGVDGTEVCGGMIIVVFVLGVAHSAHCRIVIGRTGAAGGTER